MLGRLPASDSFEREAGSSFAFVGAWAGKAVAIQFLLDTALAQYDVPPASVRRVFLSVAELARAIEHKEIDAVLAVGVAGSEGLTEAVNKVAVAGHGPPVLRRLVVTITSGMASLADNTSGGSIAYRSSRSVAYGAGLRVSEVVSLKVSDIDSKRMMLRGPPSGPAIIGTRSVPSMVLFRL